MRKTLKYKGPQFSVYQVDKKIGKAVVKRDLIERADGVVIIPIDSEGNVYLVKEFCVKQLFCNNRTWQSYWIALKQTVFTISIINKKVYNSLNKLDIIINKYKNKNVYKCYFRT